MIAIEATTAVNDNLVLASVFLLIVGNSFPSRYSILVLAKTVLVLALPPTGVDSATLAKLIEIYLSAASFLFLLSLGVGKK